MNDILKEHFGYSKLKDKQEEIINSILDGNDTIGVLSTGYGKSICYQLPYLITKKNVIIISPLISLMEDQYNKLKNLNISVYCLNSNNSNKNEDKNSILDGNHGLIYMSPEYFHSSETFIKSLAKKKLISLITIDESHCISTWCDFRPEYRELSNIRKWAKNIPILALTATATDKIISDIKKTLSLNEPNLIKSSFHRENLDINLVRKYNKEIDLNEIVDLVKKLGKTDKAIIYCKTKDETDDFVLRLKEHNIKSKSYHAGKTNQLRNKIQDKFTNGSTNIIIATIAFGMGIDIPNIRLIVNYGISKDMESFYQEIGRAGRDGNKSQIYVYWSNGDLNVNKSFLNNISDVNFKKKQMNRILEMEKFVNNNGCRMKYITKYFGEDISNCNHCDYCLSNKDEIKIDITNESYQIIKTVKLLKYSFGTSMISEILFGSDSKKLKSEYKKISTFGKLKHVKKDRIKEIIRFLIINSYLIEEKLEKSFGSVIKITNKGTNFVSVSLDEVIDNIFEVKINESKSESLEDNKKLEDKFKKFRIEMSNLEGCKLYQVLSNNTIDLLATTKIESLNDLRKINGIGDKKIEKYGEKLLELIQS